MKRIIYCIAALSVFIGCSKEFNIDAVKPVDTDVRLANALRYDDVTGCYVVKKDSPVTFEFSGSKVDDILFYSGEIGHEYRYRTRSAAGPEAALSVNITVRTALLKPKSGGPCRFELLYCSHLPSYSPSGVENAEWVSLAADLQQGSYSTADVTTDFKAENVSPEYLSAEDVVFAIKAKSDEAQSNRLRLREFTVVGTEKRDYSYTLDGLTVNKTKERSTTIFKACLPFDDSYRVSNDATAACWSSYTPLETTPEGLGYPVRNSQYYVWNVAGMGLRYGEGSGYPMVKTNEAGQSIKCSYDVDIYEPTLPITLPDGRVLQTPSDPLRKQPSESWLISRSHNPRQVSRDEASNIIKNKSMGMVSDFSYSWKDTGRFRASFSLDNQNVNGGDFKIVEFDIIVVD